MARYPNAASIYDFASLFAEECLFKDGSLFWPGESVWTLENLEVFWEAFIEHPDLGSDAFVIKWSKQLEGLSPNIFRLATEVTSIYCLFPYKNSMGFASKQSLVNQVMQMGSDTCEVNAERWGAFTSAIDGDGIGTTGAGYLAARPFHIGMYLAFALEVKRSTVRTLAAINAKQLVDAAFQNAAVAMNYKPLTTRNMILHLLWPDEFEATASVDHKQAMARLLSEHFGLTPLADVDGTILQARRHMEDNEGFPKAFDMYSDDVWPLWDKTKAPTISRKFELAAQFRERVLESNCSFLWPDAEDVWTAENALIALDAVKHLAGQGQKEADAQIIEIARENDRPIFQILCDVRAAYVLKTPLKNWIARSHLNIFTDVREPFDGDEQTIEALVDSASNLYPGSIWGGGGEPTINHMLIILAGLQAILVDPESVGDRDTMVDRLFNHSVKIENDGIMYFPFWSLMYLMYPQQFASAPAWSTRTQILKKLSHITAGTEYPNYMAELAAIRSKLDPDFDPYTFDFFVEPWKSTWKNGGTPPPPPPPPIDELAAATYLDVPFLREIDNLLKDKKQLIFEGPPGSGKTFVADKFARYFAGQPLNSDDTNEQIELVQFHQSYSYEDFVEGIRPRTNDAGQLVYDVEPGIFREFAARAHTNPDKPFVLIIDEINRGNVSRILGELMLLLEYRDKSARLPYSKELLRIPDNLYIIGTMNSADRSLSQIDYALRRRFYFVRFMSVFEGTADVLDRWLQVTANSSASAADRQHVVNLFVELNSRLSTQLKTDDLQVGHSYFMHKQMHEKVRQEQVWKYAVEPLLREYLYHDREREKHMDLFSLETIRAAVTKDPEDTAATSSNVDSLTDRAKGDASS